MFDLQIKYSLIPQRFALWGLSTAMLLTGPLLASCSTDYLQIGCSSDDECRINRVCYEGSCIFPELLENNQSINNQNNEPVPSGPNNNGIENNSTNNSFVDPGESNNNHGLNNIENNTYVENNAVANNDINSDPDPPDPGVIEGPRISISPVEQLIFGPVPLNTTVEADLIVQNLGDETLYVTQAQLGTQPSDGFEMAPPIADNNEALMIEAGQQEFITVFFNPEEAGPYRNSILIHSNDEDNSIISLDLRGQGINQMARPCVTLSPGAIDFGQLPLDSHRSQTITFMNCGTARDIVISDLWLADSSDSDFTLGLPESLPWSIPVGGTQTFNIVYHATTEGSVDDVLLFVSDAIVTPNPNVELKGYGGDN